ncbi:hypothetical protein IFR04_006798 [Cadophora malorum]|uniref:RNA ligase domain-containing protein n=1 Tax=Cadophora malorum TaxID=108018 RepID=A0A8H7THY9_9HELO|nr:hypothetical protein IFR04_006798 [Cadophora malorum]
MAQPDTPSVDEVSRNPFQLQEAGKATLPTPPITPQLSMTPPAAASGGKKIGKAAVLKITDTTNKSRNGSASNYKDPTTKSVTGLSANNQQTVSKKMGTGNGRDNSSSSKNTSGPKHNPTSNTNPGPGKGKAKSKAKKAAPAPPQAPIVIPKTFITTFPDQKASTLFPKITGDLTLIESRYRVDNRKGNRDRTVNVLRDEVTRFIRFIGTVKLHGQHADIVINPDNTIRLQSRNRPVLHESQDILGFAKTMFTLEKNILQLKQRIEGRWMELNRNGELSETHPLVIAGEWVGPGIQKNVALDELPRKYFVITAISLNNFWLDDQLYADIEDEDAGIVHVGRGGFFSEELDVTDLESCQERMMAIALEVEKTCPFSQSFGIMGRGEGIVWKATQPLGKDPRMWVKTKGPSFAVTRTADLPKPVAKGNTTLLDDEMIERTRQFAYATTTEPRLQQLWQVMELEYAMPMDKTSKKKFMQYVSDDILREEKSRIKACKVDEQYLIKCVRWMAELWYDQRLDKISRWQAASMQLEGGAVQSTALGSNDGGRQLQPETKGVGVTGVDNGLSWW